MWNFGINPFFMDYFYFLNLKSTILNGLIKNTKCFFKGTTYHAQKYSATMHDYYRIKLSESLIFLGFSRLLAFDLMGVIWREEIRIQNGLFLCRHNYFDIQKT